MMSGGSHRHTYRVLLVPLKSTKSPVTSPPRGALHNTGVACNISHGCRPLGSQQKGQETKACEPKHLMTAACPSQSGSRTMTSPVHKILHRLQSRLSQCLLEAQPLLGTSEIVAPTRNSVDDKSPPKKQSELCCCFSVPPSMTSFLLLTFQFPRW